MKGLNIASNAPMAKGRRGAGRPHVEMVRSLTAVMVPSFPNPIFTCMYRCGFEGRNRSGAFSCTGRGGHLWPAAG